MNSKKLLAVGTLNIIIVIAEIVFGVLSNSLALITDALHNLGDVLALGIAFLAAHYATKEPDEKMTFGFVRAEMMAAFVNSVFLCVTMVFVFAESIKRLANPVDIAAGQVIWVALIALIANGISAYLLGHEHHHEHHHHHEHNHCEHEHEHHHDDLNIKAAYLHMLGDAAISLGVIIGAVATLYLNTPYIDPIISMLFGIYIFKSSFGILKTSFARLMDASSDDISKFEQLLLSFDGVCTVHDLHIISPSSKDKFFSAHIVLTGNPTLSETEELLEAIRAKLESVGVTHSLLQPETMKYAGVHGHCCTH